MSAWNRLEKRWNDIQVGRQGSYSVERLESFDSYCKVTSYTRVISVCLLTPLPALLAVLLLECLPLRPPSEGWSANWVFWIRLALMQFTIGCTSMYEMAKLVPVMEAPFSKVLVAATLVIVANLITALAATRCIGFPLPLISQAAGVVDVIYVPVALVLGFGKAPFTSNSPCRPYLQRFQRFHVAYMALIAIYPLYRALYDLIPSTYRGVTIIVLPIWRFGAKSIMMNGTRDLEDFMPQIVSFTVDLYSTLFISVCMSSAGSVYLSALFIAADVGQTLLEFREVRTNANVLVSQLYDRHSTRNSTSTDLLAMVLAVVRNPSASNITCMQGARLEACIPHPLATGRREQLELLGASGAYSHCAKNTGQDSRLMRCQRRSIYQILLRKTSIVPVEPNLVKVLSKRDPTNVSAQPIIHSGDSDNNGKQSKQLVLQGLQLLFHCEYLALVEYVECVVPIVFVTYKSVLEQLPNIVYYPGGAGNWGAHAVVNILVFAALEIGSFLILNQFLQRKFAFSPLYQVSFVLETQAFLVQAKLFLSLVLLLSCELAHLGVDFSFRFEWLR